MHIMTQFVLHRPWSVRINHVCACEAHEVRCVFDVCVTPECVACCQSLNSMNFPAGIIQPHFFSENYPAHWNYAALGAVMESVQGRGCNRATRAWSGPTLIPALSG
jgi:hypothetical protein